MIFSRELWSCHEIEKRWNSLEKRKTFFTLSIPARTRILIINLIHLQVSSSSPNDLKLLCQNVSSLSNDDNLKTFRAVWVLSLVTSWKTEKSNNTFQCFFFVMSIEKKSHSHLSHRVLFPLKRERTTTSKALNPTGWKRRRREKES